MAGGEEKAVVIDASVLINLAIIDRVDLLAALGSYRFVVPLDALEEVVQREQRRRVDAAITEGTLRTRKLSEPSILARRAEFLRQMDPGEAACLALALEEGWLVACDPAPRGHPTVPPDSHPSNRSPPRTARADNPSLPGIPSEAQRPRWAHLEGQAAAHPRVPEVRRSGGAQP